MRKSIRKIHTEKVYKCCKEPARRIASKIFYNKFHKNANTIGIISGFAARNKSFSFFSKRKKSLSEQAIKMNKINTSYEDVCFNNEKSRSNFGGGESKNKCYYLYLHFASYQKFQI